MAGLDRCSESIFTSTTPTLSVRKRKRPSVFIFQEKLLLNSEAPFKPSKTLKNIIL